MRQSDISKEFLSKIDKRTAHQTAYFKHADVSEQQLESKKHSRMTRSISPPTAKKRKLSSTSDIEQCSTKVKQACSEQDAPNQPTMRVFSWNINGISPFLQQSITSFFSPVSKTCTQPVASLRSFLQRHDFPDVLLLQEVKINPSDRRTQMAVSTAVNARLGPHDRGPAYITHHTLPSDRYNARGFGGKVYGVCSIISTPFQDQFVERVRDVDWDSEGRVSVIELKNRTAIWNIYAVNGTTNPYRHSVTGVTIGTRHDKKRAFHQGLLEECRKMEADGWRHIIVGDLNVAPARIDGHPNLRTWPDEHVVNRADFNWKFLDSENAQGLRAVDIWREQHPQEKAFTYYPRGVQWGSSCDRVDVILASRSLWSEGKIINASILNTQQERGPSDHVPISVEILVERAETIRSSATLVDVGE